jgi:hypothetical protein
MNQIQDSQHCHISIWVDLPYRSDTMFPCAI